MRVVRVQGGLGNQLFCLAFADSIARLVGGPVGLDLTSYGHDFYGRIFETKDLFARRGDFVFTPRRLLGSRPIRVISRFLPVPGIIREKKTPLDREGLKQLVARQGYFDGYWQNEDYIFEPEAFSHSVRALVMSKSTPVPEADLVIHFRTYKEERRADARGTPGRDYFRRALEFLSVGGDPPRRALLLSDTPELARERIGDIGVELVVPDGGMWGDMALLMAARRLILTNSSFSWWGGFCNPHAQITYPERGECYHYPFPAARFKII